MCFWYLNVRPHYGVKHESTADGPHQDKPVMLEGSGAIVSCPGKSLLNLRFVHG